MAEDVNKAWTDNHTRSVYHLMCCFGWDASGWDDFLYTVTLDGDISIEPGIASTIYYLRTTDQNINAT